ncbi:uncharacterized protein [Haliotis cracherodii]|uniref:uncharacterized protein n=1 Tax=Haliotis cracherodii TaxID=6455 RepID=UPI0039ED430E
MVFRSLRLTTFPTRITEGNTYNLMCSSSAGSRDIQWSRNSDLIVRTRYVSATQCAEDVVNPNAFNTFLSGRINTSCGFNQHNVTLRISAQKDNGSVWWCVDLEKSDRSNNLTIEVMTVPTTSSPTSVTSLIERTTTNTEETPNVVFIVIGVIGGAVVGCVITAAVVIAWMKKRNIRREDNINTPNIYDSASGYEDMDHQYGIVERQYVNTVEGTATDTPDYVNTDEDKRDTDYYNIGHDTHLP